MFLLGWLFPYMEGISPQRRIHTILKLYSSHEIISQFICRHLDVEDSSIILEEDYFEDSSSSRESILIGQEAFSTGQRENKIADNQFQY
jgi:hypothetical protein